MKSEDLIKERIEFLKECIKSGNFTLSKERLFNDWIDALKWVLDEEE